MNEQGSIPPNIKRALEADIGYVIAVAGQPGTGKSLFVHEVLQQYPKSFLYATTTESTGPSKETDSDESISDRRMLVKYWRNTDVDSAHEESLNNQIQGLTGRTPKDKDIVIIDSWREFLQPISVEKNSDVRHSLLDAARRESRRLILVLEGDKSSADAHILHSADAIVELRKLRLDQRMYRQLTLEKMRSFPIMQDTYLFTLYGGRFTFIPWYKHQFPPITIEREPIADPANKTISTGNRSLDSVLGGGFRRGRLSLIEVEDISAPYVETICIPFLSNHLQLGRPAVIVLPEGWSPDRFVAGLSQFVDMNVVEDQVVFFGRHALGSKGNVRTIDTDPEKTLQEIRYEASQLERRFEKSVTELFALDTLENRFGDSAVKDMVAETSAGLSGTERSTITILSSQQSLQSSGLSYDLHLRIQDIFGVITICGVNPRTGLLAVKPVLSGGFLDYELLPIV
jgi:KaiC/GvpD/RAD55 family RecA-like ATPase